MCERDLAVLWLLHSDPQAFELDTIGPLTVVDQMERVLSMWLAAAEADGFGYQLVSTPAGDALGVTGLSGMDLGGRRVANAYVRFFPEAWGRGYARAALGECIHELEAAATAGTIEKVPAEAAFVTAAGNAPARSLAEKLGFTMSAESDPTETGEHVVLLKVLRTGRTGNA